MTGPCPRGIPEVDTSCEDGPLGLQGSVVPEFYSLLIFISKFSVPIMCEILDGVSSIWYIEETLRQWRGPSGSRILLPGETGPLGLVHTGGSIPHGSGRNLVSEKRD